MSVLSKLTNLFAAGNRVDLDKRFQRIRPVGQGSMSKLFQARDLKTGRTVALKVLDMAKTAELMARKTRSYGKVKYPSEGEVCVQLRHPNVVQTYEHGISTRDEQFLVMEFIEGVGLNFLIETKSASLNGKRIGYLAQAADGLAYVHRQNFIHRDICPRNMMVTPDGTLKLIDFGLALPNTPEFRRPGNRTGTAHYMAPELIKRLEIDERIDIFSFGVTAFECVVGRLPWDTVSDSLQMARQLINTLPHPAKKLRPDLDDELNQLLMRGIAQSPKDRTPSIQKFADALRALPKQDY